MSAISHESAESGSRRRATVGWHVGIATLGGVGLGMIDGDRWISERLAFLRETLKGDLSAHQREATEAEISALTKERGIHPAGPHLLRLPRRLTAWGRARTGRPSGDLSATRSDEPRDS